jgi:2-isopropylmalate synthase
MPEPNSPEQLKPVKIYDTTLRDGIQATDINATQANAFYVAESLAEAGVDVIEAGFPSSSEGNFATVHDIAKKVDGPIIAAFAMTKPESIAKAGEAIEPAGGRGRINVCAPVSDLHIEKRLGIDRNSLLKLAVKSTEQATEFTDDVQFSFEDSTRADLEFLKETVLAVAEAGARTMMLPDTVGVLLPREYSKRLLAVREALDERGFTDVEISAHCHNDLGQGVMSSIDALRYGGAQQVETTIGGFGERNGNSPLEVVAGIIAVKGSDLGLSTNVDPLKLRNLVYNVAPEALGGRVSEKQPFVGSLSYMHGSGMHQDGIMKHKSTFKDFSSAIFGFDKPFEFKLSDQSGKAGVRYELASTLNISVDESTLRQIADGVKKRSNARGNKNLGHNELEELVSEITGEKMEDKFKLEAFSFSGNSEEDAEVIGGVEGDSEGICEATLKINGEEQSVVSDGGVVDAAKQAIEGLIGFKFDIKHWQVVELEEGSDAIVGVTATVVHNGYEINIFTKSKISENAGVEALMQAVNIIHRLEERAEKSVEPAKTA